MRLKNIEFNYRNLNVLMKYEYMDGSTPAWDVYVRWPGYKKREYFITIPAWNRSPYEVKEVVKLKIDKELYTNWEDQS